MSNTPSEDAIKLAREAGFPDWWINPPEPERQDGNALDMLTRLIELAKAEEREACALECESRQANRNRTHTHPDECAAAIRARSNT